MSGASLVACHECGLLQRAPALRAGTVLHCARCDAHLRRGLGRALDHLLPLSLAAAILFVMANALPIVAIEAAGEAEAASLLGAVTALYAQEQGALAMLVMLTTFVFPAIELSALVYAALVLALPVPRVVAVLRLVVALRRWAMVEVFLLGVLVASVKLAGVVHVVAGAGLWSLIAFILVAAATHASLDAHDYWTRIEARPA